MESCHIDIILHNPIVRRLVELIQERREKRAGQSELSVVSDFESIEQDIHTVVMAIERDLVGEELRQCDVSAKEIEVDGKVYRRGAKLPETYLTAAGCVSVERYLYSPTAEEGKSICPLELRSGIIAGYFTPRAARQGAFAMAHLTPGDSEALFEEIGNMHPSRSSLDRLTKVLSPHWEVHREAWEAQIRQTETVPATAVAIAISVDGVMAPMRSDDEQEKVKQPSKRTGGPKGYKEVGCGTVTLYDQEANRLQTVRYARMPESKKVSLQQQVETEVASILALTPALQRVHLADGAKDNWRLMNDIEDHLPTPAQAPIEIVDYYHACDHLKNGCDAAWGDGTQESQDYFERLKIKLKENNNGAELVIRTLRFQHSQAIGRKGERLETELTYFRNQKPRMDYAEYIRRGLPIASGVMEAACKTLVTQRLKRSGMIWTNEGGQAILTLRSLIQSDRWRSAWTRLSADFRKIVNLPNQPDLHPVTIIDPSPPQPFTSSDSTQPLGLFEFVAMVMAA